MGYLLASPLRRWWMQNPEDMLAPYIRTGMTVLEPGPGMGFFTLPLAEMVGPTGRVIALDVQEKMLDGVRRKASREGLLDRIETRVVRPDNMGIDDLRGTIDFVLAFAVVHEMPSAAAFFQAAAAGLKHGGQLFFAEPSGHVKPAMFHEEMEAARAAGLEGFAQPQVRGSHTAVLRKA
jgi:2-polyprenyl-3-methyl-5-hydroxy-6-metoxy-1,4-benzoquinol methylase